MTCNESAIKPALTEVVSKMEPCPKYNSLKNALNELASLLPDNNLMNVMSSTSVINSLKPLSAAVPVPQNAVPAPQNAAVPVPQNAVPAPQNTSTVNAAVPGPQNAASASAAVPAVNVNPAPAATIDDSEVIAYNVGKLSTTYGKIKQMLENTLDKNINKTIQEDNIPKIQELLEKVKNAKKTIEVQNLMNLFGNFEITGKGSSQYYKIGINGGTRKRRMRRVKTQRRRKNARTIKKKKITNNKSGKRN
jgi:hypothetical protein